ncbi:hypothetical protein [Halobacillus sp. A5]|nr:hypothetical protein [Halobacillus sp. A5]
MTIHFFIFTISISRERRVKDVTPYHQTPQEELLSRKAAYRKLY